VSKERVSDLARELKIYLPVVSRNSRTAACSISAVIFSPDAKIIGRSSKSHTADDEPFNP